MDLRRHRAGGFCAAGGLVDRGGWSAPVGLDPGSWCPPQAPRWKTRENTEALCDRTGALCGDRCWVGLATVITDVEGPPGLPDPVPQPWQLDRQGWSTLVAGVLLLLISLTTNYGDVNVLRFSSLQTADQIGVGLHLAALAAFSGDVQLVTRLRHRDAWTREREAYEAA